MYKQVGLSRSFFVWYLLAFPAAGGGYTPTNENDTPTSTDL